MDTTRHALLVIDMQLVAFDGKVTAAVANPAMLLQRVSGLIATCRAAGLPVVYLQTCALAGQPYAKDVHGWEIHPKVAPRPADKVVYKVQSNGFEETNLHQVLAKLGTKTLITCGIWSEYCVTATSQAAMQLGYQVCVAADAHSTVADSDVAAEQVVARQNAYLAEQSACVLAADAIGALLA